MARTARDAQPPLPSAARLGGLPPAPGRRPRLAAALSEALHRPGWESPPPPPPAGSSLPALGWATPRRAPPPRARARRGCARTSAPGDQPAPPRRPARWRPRPRSAWAAPREGERGGAERRREGGPLSPRPPPRRKCAPSARPRSSARPTSPPGARPSGGCALSPEEMFNGNQRWKKTLEDPIVPPAFTDAPTGSQARGWGLWNTHVGRNRVASKPRIEGMMTHFKRGIKGYEAQRRLRTAAVQGDSVGFLQMHAESSVPSCSYN